MSLHEKYLRDQLIKVAFKHPEMRPDLLPILRKTADLSDVDVEEGKMHRLLGLDEDQTISEYGSARAAAQKLISEVGKQEAAGMINWAANISGDDFLKKMQEELPRID